MLRKKRNASDDFLLSDCGPGFFSRREKWAVKSSESWEVGGERTGTGLSFLSRDRISLNLARLSKQKTYKYFGNQNLSRNIYRIEFLMLFLLKFIIKNKPYLPAKLLVRYFNIRG